MAFYYLTILSGIILASIAAFFSVAGLAAIFTGAFASILVMGGALEFSKIIASKYLYSNWNKLSTLFKTYLCIAVAFLMVLTSMGIFGYLAKSAQNMTQQTQQETIKLQHVENRIEFLTARKQELNINLQTLDDLVGTFKNSSKETTAQQSVYVFHTQRNQRNQIETEVKDINAQLSTLQLEQLEIQQKIRSVEVEVGPAIYIAQALYGSKDTESIEKAVLVVIFMIIFAFDPLAIVLLVTSKKPVQEIPAQKAQEPIQKPRRRIKKPVVVPVTSKTVEKPVEDVYTVFDNDSQQVEEPVAEPVEKVIDDVQSKMFEQELGVISKEEVNPVVDDTTVRKTRKRERLEKQLEIVLQREEKLLTRNR